MKLKFESHWKTSVRRGRYLSVLLLGFEIRNGDEYQKSIGEKTFCITVLNCDFSIVWGKTIEPWGIKVD